jgi:DhnA family fructose-bisphosphate aldolase class Ia
VLSNHDIRELVTDSRRYRPNLPDTLASQRRRPKDWYGRRLVLVAADHPARGSIAAGDRPTALADRAELLRRLAYVLMHPAVDGALVTPDILEELWWLNAWVTEQGGPDFLQDKILIGSMNRAGLEGAVFELDDFVSSYTVDAIVRRGLDAAKLLLRVDWQQRDCSRTLRYVAEALSALDQHEVPVFLEPIAVPLTVDTMVRLIGVASGLGPSSRRRWLKVPMVQPFEPVAAATTLPLVLLGGNRIQAVDAWQRTIEQCLSAGPNVVGVLMGRSVLFPAEDADPWVPIRALAAVLGKTWKEEERWGGL